MAETILIDATQAEEVRVATVDDDKNLCDLIVEPTRQNQRTGNIYKAVVRRCEPSLAAYFVDFGGTRDGFLAFKELAGEYVKSEGRGKPNYEQCLKVGQEIIVRVVKDERVNKGAALTTYISLAGFYSVLMPNKPKAGGISRHIEGDERDELKQTIGQLEVPKGMGVIVRTAGMGRSREELQWDVDNLLVQWDEIKKVAKSKKGPFLIRQESDVLMRAIRDHIRPTVKQIIINEEQTFNAVKEFIGKVRPDFVNKVKMHKSNNPLFTEYRIESQIETAFTREVVLSNGASIVLDQTEALLAIDINSAKATEGADIEETAFLTNLAAAKEISRQLRLRDAGGLVVIDFIDMKSTRHQREVEEAMIEALKSDRARVQVGRISRFGLLEMSRQRLRSSLGDANQDICPRCSGYGRLRSAQSLALSILRLVEESAMRANITGIRVQAPVEVATYLTNEKRTALAEIERNHQVHAMIIANAEMMTPQYKIDLLRDEEAVAQLGPSFLQTQSMKKDEESTSKGLNETPAIKSFVSADMPQAPTPAGESLVKRIWTALFGSDKPKASQNKRGRNNRSNNRNRNRGRNNQRRRGGDEQRTQGNRNRRSNNKRVAQNDKREQSDRREQQQDNRRRQQQVVAESHDVETVITAEQQAPQAHNNNAEGKSNTRRARGSRLHGRRRRSNRKDEGNNQSSEQTAQNEQQPQVQTEQAHKQSQTQQQSRQPREQQAAKPEQTERKPVEAIKPAPTVATPAAPVYKSEQSTATNVLRAPTLPSGGAQPVRSKAPSQKTEQVMQKPVPTDKLPASARARRSQNQEQLVQIKSGEDHSGQH